MIGTVAEEHELIKRRILNANAVAKDLFPNLILCNIILMWYTNVNSEYTDFIEKMIAGCFDDMRRVVL